MANITTNTNTHSDENDSFRLIFDGKMTIACANQLEDRVISAMRKYRHLEVDLSEVREIDRCGIHLIRLMQAVGGKGVRFIAASPIVERAVDGLLASTRENNRGFSGCECAH